MGQRYAKDVTDLLMGLRRRERSRVQHRIETRLPDTGVDLGFGPHHPAEVEEHDLDGAGHGRYFRRWPMCSPTRSAFAMIVSAGFTAALDGKKLPSTT